MTREQRLEALLPGMRKIVFKYIELLEGEDVDMHPDWSVGKGYYDAAMKMLSEIDAALAEPAPQAEAGTRDRTTPTEREPSAETPGKAGTEARHEAVAWTNHEALRILRQFPGAVVNVSGQRFDQAPIPLFAKPQYVDGAEGCTPTDIRILRQANTDLGAESALLRDVLSELVEAVDGMDNLDEQDGVEFWKNSQRLDAAMEAARPHTEAALLAKAQGDLLGESSQDGQPK